MTIRGGMLLLLGLASGLSVLRHVVFWDVVVADPGGLCAEIDRQVAVVEWTSERALPEIRSGKYQPVDLRRDAPHPFIGGQMPWSLPLPHSLQILARYRANAKAERLAFVVTAPEREEGLAVLRLVCREVGVREAVLVVGPIDP